MTAIDPAARFCGPAAFAYVVGGTRQNAAKALRHWSQHAGCSPDNGIKPIVLAAALLFRGYELERWSAVGRWIDEDKHTFAQNIWCRLKTQRAAFERIGELLEERDAELEQSLAECSPFVRERVRSRVTAALAIQKARSAARRPTPLTVGQWRRRRRVGVWILFVHQHVLVVRDGQFATGARDDEDDEVIKDVWRVVPATSKTLQTHTPGGQHVITEKEQLNI